MSEIGFLIHGKFVCPACTATAVLDSWAGPIRVYESNVRPYSQRCCKCKKLIVDGLRRIINNEPLEIFDSSISYDNTIEFQFACWKREWKKAIDSKDSEAILSYERKLTSVVLKEILEGDLGTLYAKELKEMMEHGR